MLESKPAMLVQSAVDRFVVAGEVDAVVVKQLRAAVRHGEALGVSSQEAARSTADAFLERLRLREDVPARELAQAGRELGELFKVVH
jgi:predicted ATP-grasp superfamily ATP-dependent carboligase